MSTSPKDRQTATQPLPPPKRPLPPMDQQHQRKRRARYVWQACDMCRRRKGRCDGRTPCVFCRARALDCRYSSDPDPSSGSAPPDEVASVTVALPPNFLGKGEAVSRLMLALQAQLDNIAAHMESCNDAHVSPDAHVLPDAPIHASFPERITRRNALTTILPAHDALMSSSATMPSVIIPTTDATATVAASTIATPAVAAPAVATPAVTAPAVTAPAISVVAPAAASPPKNVTRRFCGPTSPDYSLNAAEIKLRQAQAPPGGTSLIEENNPSLDDDHSDEDQHNLVQGGHGSGAQSRATSARLRQCLVQLPRLLARNETLRLLNVYQEVIGHLHPILNFQGLIEQAEASYMPHRRSPSDPLTIQDDTILILFLALAIALAAETGSQSYVGMTLYKSVEHLIKLKLASEVSSLDHVLIALLAAIYHFFNDETRLAWRVCGISGHLAMELGLHRRGSHHHLLRDEKQLSEISALLWSIVVLDRQWSAVTGLPQNFQESDFNEAMEPPENASYLRAMISYTFMSPKFEKPIYHVAAGASYDQDDAFEVLNFQIDQWLKKAIEGQNIFHSCPAEAIGVIPIIDHSKRPSPTATLLYLRANAFRSIILRPFFLTSLPSHVSVKMITRSMAVISDTIGVLTLLDSTTDIYRSQHPFFQHFLNSSCALLFLVVAYFCADRNRSLIMQSSNLREPFPELVKREVERALALASAYSTLSQISNRLTKRLRHLEEQLSRSDFLQPTNGSASDQSQPGRALMENGGAANRPIVLDPSDVMYAMDESMGEDALNGGWWNDIDMLLPDWPNSEVMGGHWA